MSDTISKRTLVVNFLAGPGAGKSTIAGSVFAELKWLGVDCELVTEYAKDKVWEESYKTLANQLYVLGKQSHRNFRLDDKVEVMITDSSVLMSLLYSTEEGIKHLSSLKLQLMNLIIIIILISLLKETITTLRMADIKHLKKQRISIIEYLK